MLDSHNHILYKVAKSYAYDDYEDLYQEIAIQLWRSHKTFQGDSKLSTWIYKVALNTAFTFKSKKKKLDYRQAQPIEIDPGKANLEKLDLLYKTINKLKLSYKTLILLQLEGYDYEEISQITGISKNLVGVKLTRAKNKLQSLVKNSSL